MDSMQKAFDTSFSVIAFYLILFVVILLFGGAYAYVNYKIDNDDINTSLVQMGTDDNVVKETEDKSYRLYKGRKEYHTSFGDTYTPTNRLNGSMYDDIAKSDISNARKTGEAATGASVFAEIKALPASVVKVHIDGHTIGNKVEQADSQTIGSYINIPYYLKRGMQEELLSDADIDLTRSYLKSYIYDDKYGYITEIVYTKL